MEHSRIAPTTVPPFRAALRVLAELAPRGTSSALNVAADGQPFLWFGTRLRSSQLFLDDAGSDASIVPVASTAALLRMASLDDLDRQERALRAGWLFLCGKASVGTQTKRILVPLVSRPVRIAARRLSDEQITYFDTLTGAIPQEEMRRHQAEITRLNNVKTHLMVAAGDTRITSLVEAPADRMDLEARLDRAFPKVPMHAFASTGLFADRELGEWVRTAVKAAGLSLPELLPLGADPRDPAGDDGLYLALGLGLYTSRDVILPGQSGILEEWAGRAGIEGSAFAEMYSLPTGEETAAVPARRPIVESTLDLTDEQEAVVDRVRRERIVALSGPPGNGKSHTVAATALDTVARGETVLIATQSQYAAQVIVELMGRQPGPTPVAFGDLEHRGDLADKLLDDVKGLWRDSEDIRAERVLHTAEQVATAERALLDRLHRDQRYAWASGDGRRLDALQRALPRLFGTDPSPDFDDLAKLAAHADRRSRQHGPFAELRRDRAEERLRELSGARDDLAVDDVIDAVGIATAIHAATDLDREPDDVVDLAATLLDTRTALRHARGDQLAAAMRARQHRDKKARFVVEQLVTSLRAGRAQRRRTLLDLDGEILLRTLPLWVGTLGDIEDLLPPIAGLFDLVILDEASQIEQGAAASALLRSQRAMIVGDPRQLRHVSFVADADVRAAVATHHAEPLASRLDVRRNSIFDVAAGVSPVIWLSEHFRSVPHLIDFSSRRFYSDRMLLRTRRPSTERLHAIERVCVAGSRPKSGVNATEVEAVREVMRRLTEEGVESIGAVTPFKAQATALEKMVLKEFSAEEIARLDLRVGTVHAFQGSECDVVVASMVVTPTDAPGSRRFVDDPNLFNVLVTRARERMVVVTSVDPAPDDSSLLAAYLRHAVDDLTVAADRAIADPWVEELAGALGRRGVVTRAGFPFASWALDLCLADGGHDDVVFDCRVHPAGPHAHMEQLHALLTSGWTVLDAHPSTHDNVAPLAADRLISQIP